LAKIAIARILVLCEPRRNYAARTSCVGHAYFCAGIAKHITTLTVESCAPRESERAPDATAWWPAASQRRRPSCNRPAASAQRSHRPSNSPKFRVLMRAEVPAAAPRNGQIIRRNCGAQHHERPALAALVELRARASVRLLQEQNVAGGGRVPPGHDESTGECSARLRDRASSRVQLGCLAASNSATHGPFWAGEPQKTSFLFVCSRFSNRQLCDWARALHCRWAIG